MNWQTPQELPDLRRVGIVALDTEDERRGPARRPRLGLAVARRSCCGISVAWRDGRRASARIYIPLRHPDSDNFDPVAGLSAGSRI